MYEDFIPWKVLLKEYWYERKTILELRMVMHLLFASCSYRISINLFVQRVVISDDSAQDKFDCDFFHND